VALPAIFGNKRSFQSMQYTTNKQQSQAFFYFLWISASFHEKKIQKKPTIEGLGKKINAILLERGGKRGLDWLPTMSSCHIIKIFRGK
jgi:hypothetical protein|tara:strand:+ start:461 stop:724 length:264 start_codon:yes stop_codon:yes gene_type:complete